MKLYIFRTVLLSIIRSFFTVCMLYSWIRMELESSILIQLASCMTYTTAVGIAKETPDDGQRNCQKHVEFYYKNKFEKLVHLVGFIIRHPSICCELHFYRR
jgi:hypothetical protein